MEYRYIVAIGMRYPLTLSGLNALRGAIFSIEPNNRIRLLNHMPVCYDIQIVQVFVPLKGNIHDESTSAVGSTVFGILHGEVDIDRKIGKSVADSRHRRLPDVIGHSVGRRMIFDPLAILH